LARVLAQVKGRLLYPPSVNERKEDGRRRATTVFGWLAGGSLGLLVNYGLFLAVGPEWQVIPSTFVLFIVGCFGGMWVADRMGVRGFKVLGLTAGVLLALAASLVVAVLMSRP
jgi:hypothetical protein